MTVRRLLPTLALALVAGCGSPGPATPSPIAPASGPSASRPLTATPLPPPVLGIDWGRTTAVERPQNFDATLPPGGGNRQHPILRIPGQAIMADVATLPGGGFVAVGYVPPDWTAAAWTSPDGITWSLHVADGAAYSFPVAVATGASGTIVAVGRSGPLPVSWTSRDGTTWARHDARRLGTGEVAERMTSVVATSEGFVAGGSVGPELFERHARFWTSPDGVAWDPVPDDRGAFDNAEVRAIVAVPHGFVAVGVVGSVQDPTAAVAWTSSDGRRWDRVDDPAFDAAVAVALAVAPFGGLVAVGSDLDRREAVAWTSVDGRGWTRAPSEASRRYPGFVWMTDVTAIGDIVLAVGDYQGLQRGTAISWVSHDGLRWQEARSAPVQEQGEFYAVTPGGPGAIVVGSYGAPDSYVPMVWMTPAH